MRTHDFPAAYRAFIEVRNSGDEADVAELNAYEAAWFRQAEDNNTDLMKRFMDAFPNSRLPGSWNIAPETDEAV